MISLNQNPAFGHHVPPHRVGADGAEDGWSVQRKALFLLAASGLSWALIAKGVFLVL